MEKKTMNKITVFTDVNEGHTVGEYNTEELVPVDLLLAIAHLTEDCINYYDMDLKEVLKVTEELVATPIDDTLLN